jgi:hypothetical protein
MLKSFRYGSSWTCNLSTRVPPVRSLAAGTNTITTAAATGSHDGLDLRSFREQALIPERPMLIPRHAGSPAASLPALDKWLSPFPPSETPAADAEIRNLSDAKPDGGEPEKKDKKSLTLSPRVMDFDEWPFPYELVVDSGRKRDAVVALRDWLMTSSELADQMLAGILHPMVEESGPEKHFLQLHAPLRLLAKTLLFNEMHLLQQQQPGGGHAERSALPPVELYIAQSSLNDLPPVLQDDLPTPDLVLRAAKGDVYGSSIWLGTEPTYTPLHRDPNPNLFCQLCSRKVVRLVAPALGDRLFFEVQVQIRQQQLQHRRRRREEDQVSSSRIRSTEMMEGAERQVLHEAVWENERLPRTAASEDDVCEAELGPGDALFIPKGWWHSVKSLGTAGRLNGSVNWWFR